MKDRHYVYVAKDGSLVFGGRLGEIGERDNGKTRTVDPHKDYPLGGHHHWRILEGELVMCANGPKGRIAPERRVAAVIRSWTVYEVSPKGIVIVMENVQPGDRQFEPVVETASA